MEVSRTEAFSTDGERTGPNFDLIFSPVITFYILKGTRVSWSRAKCAASSKAEDLYRPDLDKEVGSDSICWARRSLRKQHLGCLNYVCVAGRECQVCGISDAMLRATVNSAQTLPHKQRTTCTCTSRVFTRKALASLTIPACRVRCLQQWTTSTASSYLHWRWSIML